MDQIESLQSEVARLNKIIEQQEAAILRPVIEAEGLKLLHNGGYVLPDDPDIRATRLEILFEKLEDSNTRLKVEDGKIRVLDADGRPKENETGTREITFDQLLESKARITFEKVASDGRRSPANNAPYKAPNATGRNTVLDNDTVTEYYRRLTAETDPARQRAIKDEFDRSQSGPRRADMDHFGTMEDLYAALNNEPDPVKQREIKAHFEKVLG